MSAESQGRADVVGLHVALAGASEPLSRLVAFSRTIAAEQVSQRMLRIASRELTLMLNGEACLVSQVEDGLLREVADYACTNRQVARGLSYYLTDYPTTASVLATGEVCSISADDPGADAAELFVLREMEMQAVLLVPIVVEGRGWGLIEVYDTRPRVFSGLERHLAEVAATQVGALIACFEHEERAQRLYGETLASLSNALEAKDASTGRHTEEVVRLAVAVATELQLELDAVRNVELGAVLHDIGKVRVPESILNKPGPLTKSEWAIMKTHPEVGEHILQPIQSLQAILPDRATPPRALGRHRLSGRARRQGDPARREDRGGLRRVPGDERGPAVPPVTFRGGCAGRARARCGRPVRRGLRRRPSPSARPARPHCDCRRSAAARLGGFRAAPEILSGSGRA